VIAPFLVLASLIAQQPGASTDVKTAEVLAEIRVHGNVLTPDAEIRRLAGIDVGAAVTPETPAQVAARLKDAHRF